MKMETVEEMEKILGILNKIVQEREKAYLALPRLSRSAEECRRLGQDTDTYVELITAEKAITDKYFNALQKQEWAESHKRFIETGYTSYELSNVGKEILKEFMQHVEVTCE